LELPFQKATRISPERRRVSKENLQAPVNVFVRVKTEPRHLLDVPRMTTTRTKVEQLPSRRGRNWILLISHMGRRRKNIMRRMIYRNKKRLHTIRHPRMYRMMLGSRIL